MGILHFRPFTFQKVIEPFSGSRLTKSAKSFGSSIMKDTVE